jgi:hypothetical protein
MRVVCVRYNARSLSQLKRPLFHFEMPYTEFRHVDHNFLGQILVNVRKNKPEVLESFFLL